MLGLSEAHQCFLSVRHVLLLNGQSLHKHYPDRDLRCSSGVQPVEGGATGQLRPRGLESREHSRLGHCRALSRAIAGCRRLWPHCGCTPASWIQVVQDLSSRSSIAKAPTSTRSNISRPGMRLQPRLKLKGLDDNTRHDEHACRIQHNLKGSQVRLSGNGVEVALATG